MKRLRWRVARLIAPGPIIGAPHNPGPAILVRDGDSVTNFAWLTPTTLDIQYSNHHDLKRFGDTALSYPHQTRIGTITGTF